MIDVGYLGRIPSLGVKWRMFILKQDDNSFSYGGLCIGILVFKLMRLTISLKKSSSMRSLLPCMFLIYFTVFRLGI